jgi:FtsZ-binding cell division protein ZapB
MDAEAVVGIKELKDKVHSVSYKVERASRRRAGMGGKNRKYQNQGKKWKKKYVRSQPEEKSEWATESRKANR